MFRLYLPANDPAGFDPRTTLERALALTDLGRYADATPAWEALLFVHREEPGVAEMLASVANA